MAKSRFPAPIAPLLCLGRRLFSSFSASSATSAAVAATDAIGTPSSKAAGVEPFPSSAATSSSFATPLGMSVMPSRAHSTTSQQQSQQQPAAGTLLETLSSGLSYSQHAPLYNLRGALLAGQTVALPDHIFSLQPRPDILHRMVLYQLAKRRAGNASTLRRGEVSGSTRKIYRQKGTGGARHGDIRANIFVGGGIAHGPKPKDWSFDLPKKVRKLALRMALSNALIGGRLRFVDFSAEQLSGKTKDFAEALEASGLRNPRPQSLAQQLNTMDEKQFLTLSEEQIESSSGGWSRIYMVTGEAVPPLLRSAAANLSHVHVVCQDGLNVYDVLRSDHVLLDPLALEHWAAKTFCD